MNIVATLFRTSRLALTVSIALGLGAHGCKPRVPKVALTNSSGEEVDRPPPATPADEQQAQALMNAAAAADKAGDAETAAAKTRHLVEEFPTTLAASTVFRDQLRRATEADDTPAAIKSLEKLLFYRTDLADRDPLRRQYATLLASDARYEEAAKILRPLYANSSDVATRAQLGALLGEVLAHLRAGSEALAIQVALRQDLSGAERRAIEKKAIAVVNSGLGFAEAEELWDDVSSDPDWAFLHPILAFKLAKIYYHVRDYERSEKMLELVVERFPASPTTATAATFLQRLRDRFKVQPTTIGVVLPLTGRVGRFGQHLLKAIELQLASAAGEITLVVKDNEGDATKSVNAVESLVLEHHVIAVIGPLFPKSAKAAALKAEELSVPMISLGWSAGIPEIGPHIFRTALTVSAQAKFLAKVAFENLGMKRFAILYPERPYGQEFADAFWDEVVARRGSIQGIESYEHDATSFQRPVRKLVGRHYKFARYEYINAVARLRAKRLPSHRYRAALEDVAKGLPPAIDFDAIVLPDSAKTIGLLVPHIRFEDVILTRDPAMLETIRRSTGNRNLKPVTLLGGSTWNSPEIQQQCEKCEHAVFVDGYFPANPAPASLDFVSKFRSKVGTAPGLFEAQAYDTAGLVLSVLRSGRPRDRRAFRSQLQGLTGYKGVTGDLSFDAGGEVKRELFTLTLKEGEIRKWSKDAGVPQG